jgi:hypothetical protein
MPSLRKSQSARENGAKSQGPKTEAGKQRSSKNALRHGLTSQTIVLPSEDPADFQGLLDSYLQQFRPAGPVELDLTHELAAARWRLNRLALIETQLLADSIDNVEQRRAQEIEDGDEDEPLTPAESLAKAFDRLSGGSLNFLYRIQSRLERTYSRALQNLLRLQAHRPPSDPPAAPQPDLQNEICTNEPTAPDSSICGARTPAFGFPTHETPVRAQLAGSYGTRQVGMNHTLPSTIESPPSRATVDTLRSSPDPRSPI